MEKKPNVFPTNEQMAQANQTGDEIAKQLQEENQVQNMGMTDGEARAAEEMRRRTEEQLKLREDQLKAQEEKAKAIDARRAEQMKQTSPHQSPSVPKVELSSTIPPVVPPTFNGGNNQENDDSEKRKFDAYVAKLSEPQMNEPFDVIQLPSGGKTYPGNKGTVKLAFLTTADENILTSPNLVESGIFLEILINRKLLEPGLRYKDLLPGDRMAIMLWLRATGYGHMYPVTVYDKNNEPFETEIDLTALKTIDLTVDPESDGNFSFQLPLSKNTVKFKLLTTGEVDELEAITEQLKDSIVNEEQTLILEKQIVAVNGNKDKTFIKEFIPTMRVGDAQALREHIDSIECGVDLTITVGTPGGESITTFLPFTPRFFWPNSPI